MASVDVDRTSRALLASGAIAPPLFICVFLIEGAVPGPKDGLVMVRSAAKVAAKKGAI